jgi:hypothetical protein
MCRKLIGCSLRLKRMICIIAEPSISNSTAPSNPVPGTVHLSSRDSITMTMLQANNWLLSASAAFMGVFISLG